MFYRVTDLYMGAVNISLPRDLKSLQLKYILDARYYAIQRNVERDWLAVTNSFGLIWYIRASCPATVIIRQYLYMYQSYSVSTINSPK